MIEQLFKLRFPPFNTPFSFQLFRYGMWWGGIFFFLLWGVSCQFDNDESFWIRTLSTYFLEESLEGRRIIRLDENGVNPHWEQQLGLEGDDISDMAGAGDRLWLTSASRQSVYEISARSGQLLNEYTIPNVQPSGIGVGDKYVLLTDSVNHQVVFLDKKKGDWVVRENIIRPGKVTYRSPLFFVEIDREQVGIFDARALALTQELIVGRPIFDLQNDNRFFTLVYSGQDTVFESRIDFSTRNIGGRVRTRFNKIRHSPFRSVDVGRELLDPVSLLQDQTLSLGPDGPVNDFEVDFFEGLIYFQRNDSLFRHPLSSLPQEYIVPMSGKFLRTFYYQDFIGE